MLMSNETVGSELERHCGGGVLDVVDAVCGNEVQYTAFGL